MALTVTREPLAIRSKADLDALMEAIGELRAGWVGAVTLGYTDGGDPAYQLKLYREGRPECIVNIGQAVVYDSFALDTYTPEQYAALYPADPLEWD